MKKFLSLSLLSLLAPTLSWACPSIQGVPDYNCDGKLRITVLGDSLVSGVGDTALKGKGGWVARSAARFPSIRFDNFGKPGLRSKELLTQIDNVVRRDKDAALKESLLNADIVVLDLGRNDRWLFGLPLATYRNLKRASATIKNYTNAQTGLSPIVVTAVLMLPNRGSQGPWVKALNAIILKGNTRTDPSDLRFDLVSKRLLGADQIHPTSAGYKALASTFITYLTRKLPAKMRALQVDTDRDGIPDIIERVKFNTLPDSADSDGDGFSDWQEIFVMHTDPLVNGAPTPTPEPTVVPTPA